MPHTAHLPLYCSFDVVELDLQPPYVTPGALQSFAGEIMLFKCPVLFDYYFE